MTSRSIRKRGLSLALAVLTALPGSAVLCQPADGGLAERGLAATQAISGARSTTGTVPASQPLRATITAVRGLVEVRVDEGRDWQAAKEGMVVEEGAEFRTGPRSTVQFQIPPDQTITLDRLGTIKLLTAVMQAGKQKTDIGMKYGRTRYDIAVGGVEHESTIRSPNSTLAVRGTVFSLQDERPFAPVAVSLQGQVQYKAFRKQTIAFGGKGGKAKVEGGKGGAAESTYDESYVDPTLAFARDAAEQRLVASLISTGAVVSLDRQSGIRVVRGGTVPADKDLLPLLPGNLNFVLRWQGNANLDLTVGTIVGNEVVYPASGLSSSRSGGKTAFDHQGGPNGGIEIISWPAGFPRDLYGIGINPISGPPVPANVQMYVNGRRGNIITFDQQGVPQGQTSVDLTVARQREVIVAGIGDPTGRFQLPGEPNGVERRSEAARSPHQSRRGHQ